jgi:hypothetical protein
MCRLYILVLAVNAYLQKGPEAVWPAVGDKLVIFQNAAILEVCLAVYVNIQLIVLGFACALGYGHPLVTTL